MADLTDILTVEKAWRTLSPAEKVKAEYYIGVVSRAILRRWKDVDDRITAGTLGVDDVKDVATQLVITAVDAPPIRGAKSFSEGVGPMSRSATLKTDKTDLVDFEDWMVAVFEGSTTVEPVFCMPPSGRYEGIFFWPEGRP
jgi:hypothetical protein